MSAIDKAVNTIANYVANNCPLISGSDEKVKVVQRGEGMYDIEFRRYDFHDYYHEHEDEGWFMMCCQDKLSAEVNRCLDTLPNNYKSPHLYQESCVGEKGHCIVSIVYSPENAVYYNRRR